MGLNNFEVLLDYEYGAINSFLNESEIIIKRKEQELENKIEEWNAERSFYNNAPDSFDRYETDIVEFNQFSPLLNNSFFLMSYSIFERNLFEISSYCQLEEEKQISAKDIKGKGYIDQFRRYLDLVIGVDLTNIKNEWAEIEKYQTIRNAIAHKNGVLNDIDKNLKDFIDLNQSISLDEVNKTVHIVSINFISKFTELIKRFISKLLKEIDRQKRN